MPTLVAREPWQIEAVLDLENSVFESKGYGRMPERYMAQSRFIGSFEGTECRGMVRLIGARPQLPPALTELPISDGVEPLADLVREGKLEEFGTVAVAAQWQTKRGSEVARNLYRTGFVDAKLRGVTHWLIVMERRRVAIVNRRYHFTYRPLGADEWYMGGTVATHIMAFSDVEQAMSQADMSVFRWFTAGIPEHMLSTAPGRL